MKRIAMSGTEVKQLKVLRQALDSVASQGTAAEELGADESACATAVAAL